MQGLEVIESTNLKYFTKEFTAEFYALKGMFLAQIGRSDDANKAFSAAVQMHDTLVKAWALWGDYLETVFTRDSKYVYYHASGKFWEFCSLFTTDSKCIEIKFAFKLKILTGCCCCDHMVI